jgi:hypothetical protein
MDYSKETLALSNYRMEKALENLNASKLLFDNNFMNESINRSYYSIFHSVRALIAFYNFDSKKHSGIIAFFNKNFVKEKLIDKKYSKIITKAFNLRNLSDYDDFYMILKSETLEQIKNAEDFYNYINNYIKTKIINK